MGAFDTYAATARCPRCRDLLWLSGQTKFFDPDFFGLFHRHFVPGAAQKIDVDPHQLLGPVWDDEWWRVRDGGSLDDLRVLLGWGCLYACQCELPLAIVMRLRVTADTATLTAIELHDALAEDVAAQIDLAQAPEGLWQGEFAGYRAALAKLAAQPFAARAARLHAELARRFAGPWPADPPWETMVAAARCEACGELRERTLSTLLWHASDCLSPLGAGWPDGLLRPGHRVTGDLGWLDEDVDRACWLRLRHPVPPDMLSFLSAPRRWGCPCGAGPASCVVRFAREAGGLRFEEVTLRVVRGRGDLADIDFAEATYTRNQPETPYPRWRPASREEAALAMLRGWQIYEP